MQTECTTGLGLWLCIQFVRVKKGDIGWWSRQNFYLHRIKSISRAHWWWIQSCCSIELSQLAFYFSFLFLVWTCPFILFLISSPTFHFPWLACSKNSLATRGKLWLGHFILWSKVHWLLEPTEMHENLHTMLPSKRERFSLIFFPSLSTGVVQCVVIMLSICIFVKWTRDSSSSALAAW